jgi:hypothetical protein
MAWRVAMTAVAIVAFFVAVSLVTALSRRVGDWVKARMQRLLGDWFEYASIFSLLALTVLAVMAFSFFLVPFAFWLAGVLLVIGFTVLLVLAD